MDKFYLGLDIGTQSCGIAATDENYHLLKFKGQDMWGVRLFEEAKTAEPRRVKRSTRRRMARRRERIRLLQDLFAEEIAKVDSTFFIRLNNSAFFPEDKEVEGKYSLFNDAKYTDKDFHKQYPTIYHLRKALYDGVDSDIRLLYLTLHHIVKYRGHFLFEGQDFSETQNIRPIMERLNEWLSNNYSEESLLFDLSGLENFEALVQDSSKGLRANTNELYKLFNLTTKQSQKIGAVILGGSVSLADIFQNESYKLLEKKKVSFKDASFETDIPMLQASLLGDDFQLIELLKQIYDWSILSKLLQNSTHISDAMVKVYNKHKADLKDLKAFIKTHYFEQYSNIFKKVDKKGANYCNYIGMAKINGSKVYVKKCKSNLFYDYIKKIMQTKKDELGDNIFYKQFMSDMDNNNFLPKISNADNGLFPYQLNKIELEVMLDNAKKGFPFLQNIEEGSTVAEKIISLLEFKIPYYVGPLNAHHAPQTDFAWISKRSNQKITPWNFDEVVNKEETAERFIRKMTNKCTYLKGEDVIPKNSLLYCEFNVWNQLNRLKINGELVTYEIKHKIYEELFKTQTKVTDKSLKILLKREGYGNVEDIVLEGKDSDFTASLRPYITLKRILGSLIDDKPQVGEDIILWHTLFNDRQMIKQKIMATYGNIDVVKNSINALLSLKYSDFGRLSQKLFTDIYGVDEYGEFVTIIDLLRNTNLNLQNILSRDDFKEGIDSHNSCKDIASSISYKDIEEMYLSPSVKRGVWQALQMVEEYTKAVKKEPNKIFVEVTRENTNSNKTPPSRRKQIDELFRSCGKDVEDINIFINQLSQKTDADLRQDKLYFYFSQLGRCMYTNEKISLEALSSDAYDIDHIIPQSLKKDDSLDNRVLVSRTANRQKGDNPILFPEWQTKNKSFWNLLLNKKLITKEKFARLTRTTNFSDEELISFVERQLVFTNQSAKAIAELLAKRYPNSEIVYSKATNVSEFRAKNGIFKNRDVNDLHHAHDAYLNIVVGNVYNTKFQHNPRMYFTKRTDELRMYNLEKLYNYNIANAWDRNKSLEIVKRTLDKNSPTVTRFSFTGKGAFYDETVYNKDEALFPLKEKGPLKDIKKYGGYKTLSTAYFIVVDSLDKKGKVIRTIEAVPIFYDNKYKGNIDMLTKMCEDYLGLKSPKIIIPKIKKQSLLKIDGTYAHITGKTGEQISLNNANQWFVQKADSDYIRLLSKFIELYNKKYINVDLDTQVEYIVSQSRNSSRKDMVSKKRNAELYELFIKQLSKPIYLGISSFKKVCTDLTKNKEKFNTLDLIEQANLINQIIKTFKCNAELSNLSNIGLGANAGKILIGKKIDGKNIQLINQSVGGLYSATTFISK